MLSFTIGRASIALFLNDRFYSIDNSHVNFQTIREQLLLPAEERDHALIAEMLDVRRAITLLSAGLVTVTEDAIIYDGEETHTYMASRMLDLMKEGFDLTPWATFMDNLYKNPALYVRDELYQWMEKAEMPITSDGHFIAFKKVRANYTDCHTGLFDNSPGSVLEMEREACNPDRTDVCSTGFHFCSADYLSAFGGQRVVVVKVNPADVTSIPIDYNFTKGRCCRYVVVGELTAESAAYARCWKKGIAELDDPTEFPTEFLKNVTAATPALNEPPTIDASPFPTPEQLAAARELLPRRYDSPTCLAERKLGVANRQAAAIEEATTDAGKAEKSLTFLTSDGRTITVQQINNAMQYGGSKRGAARMLDIQDSTLRGWLKKMGN